MSAGCQRRCMGWLGLKQSWLLVSLFGMGEGGEGEELGGGGMACEVVGLPPPDPIPDGCDTVLLDLLLAK